MKSLITLSLILISHCTFSQNIIPIDTLVKTKHDPCIVNIPIEYKKKDVEIAKQFNSQLLLIASKSDSDPWTYYSLGTIEIDDKTRKKKMKVYFQQYGLEGLTSHIYQIMFTHEYIKVYDAKCVFEMENYTLDKK